jgi:hypothetical protein
MSLNIRSLWKLAQELDDRHLSALVTDFGKWGSWINGGAWLHIEGRRVDWLKQAIVEKYLWEAEFALGTACKSAERGDVFYVAGCLFRCAACLVQVLFALNERYFLNEKGSMQVVGSFVLRPEGFGEITSAVPARPGGDASQLRASLQRLEQLIQEVWTFV